MLASAAAAALFWCYHLYLVERLAVGDLRIGTLHDRHAVPLYSNWNLNLSLWLLPALGAWCGLLLACRALFLSPRLSVPRTLFGAFFFFFLIGFAVSAIDVRKRPDDGGWFLPYEHAYGQKALEYWGDVPRVARWGGVQAFLERYSTRVYFDRLSFHSATHPPGGVLFLWLASVPFGHALWSAVVATVAFSGLALLPLFLLARRLYGEPAARRALALYLMAPNVVLFTTTSMDGPFSVFPITSLWLFYEATAPGRPRPLALGIALGAAMALAAFMTYASCLLGLFFGIAAALSLWRDRARAWRMVAALAAALSTFVALFAALQHATGFRPITALRFSIARDEEGMGSGHESLERVLQIGVCNLLAFLLASGIPLTVLWLRELRQGLAAGVPDARAVFVAASAATLLLAAFSTLFTAEVERIWLFLVPLLIVPAANRLHEWRESCGSDLPFFGVAGLLAAQTLGFEVFLNTRW